MRTTKFVLDVKKIKHIMVDLELSQQDLAKQVDVSASSVSLWLKGSRNPDLPSSKKLAAALGIRIDELLVRD